MKRQKKMGIGGRYTEGRGAKCRRVAVTNLGRGRRRGD